MSDLGSQLDGASFSHAGREDVDTATPTNVDDTSSDTESYYTAIDGFDTDACDSSHSRTIGEQNGAGDSADAQARGNDKTADESSAFRKAILHCGFIENPANQLFCDIDPNDTECYFCKPLLLRESAMLNTHIKDSMEAEYQEKLEGAKREMKKDMTVEFMRHMKEMEDQYEKKLATVIEVCKKQRQNTNIQRECASASKHEKERQTRLDSELHDQVYLKTELQQEHDEIDRLLDEEQHKRRMKLNELNHLRRLTGRTYDI